MITILKSILSVDRNSKRIKNYLKERYDIDVYGKSKTYIAEKMLEVLDESSILDEIEEILA